MASVYGLPKAIYLFCGRFTVELTSLLVCRLLLEVALMLALLLKGTLLRSTRIFIWPFR